jgi:hypothetical protein
MKPDLSRKGLDPGRVAAAALVDEALLSALIANLRCKKETVRFNSSEALLLISRNRPEILYSRWDDFCSLIEGDNTYWKCSGIPILANLVRVDGKRKFDKYRKTYFGQMDDRKSFIPAAYLARSMPAIVEARPDLEPEITKRLLGIDKTRHDPQRRDLVKYDIIEAFDRYFERAGDKKRILAFVKKQLGCDSPKTRKTAKRFLDKRG